MQQRENLKLFAGWTSLAAMREAAENGDPGAQCRMGELYLYGLNTVTIDYVQAAHWFKLSTDQEFARGMGKLGLLHETSRCGTTRPSIQIWIEDRLLDIFVTAGKRMQVGGEYRDQDRMGRRRAGRSGIGEAHGRIRRGRDVRKGRSGKLLACPPCPPGRLGPHRHPPHSRRPARWSAWKPFSREKT